MPATKADLTSIKRSLIAGRVHVLDASALARRMGDADLAERLRSIELHLANELDYVEGLLAGLP